MAGLTDPPAMPALASLANSQSALEAHAAMGHQLMAERDRELVVACQQHSIGEIADVIDKPANAISELLVHARRRLGIDGPSTGMPGIGRGQ